MAKKSRRTRWVIFASPQQYSGQGTLYIAIDGTTTRLRSKAARFESFEAAREFADERKIELTAARYIGQETFPAFELQDGS